MRGLNAGQALGNLDSATHALCICQTMMSSQVRPSSVGDAGLTLPSRCHLPNRPRPAGNFIPDRDPRLRGDRVMVEPDGIEPTT